MNVIQKVVRVSGCSAETENGRIVKTDGIHPVSVGDYLEIYADIAIGIVKSDDARSVRSIRKQIRRTV